MEEKLACTHARGKATLHARGLMRVRRWEGKRADLGEDDVIHARSRGADQIRVCELVEALHQHQIVPVAVEGLTQEHELGRWLGRGGESALLECNFAPIRAWSQKIAARNCDGGRQDKVGQLRDAHAACAARRVEIRLTASTIEWKKKPLLIPLMRPPAVLKAARGVGPTSRSVTSPASV